MRLVDLENRFGKRRHFDDDDDDDVEPSETKSMI